MSSDTNTPIFQPGQEWTIKDSGMTIVIGVVEPYAKGTAISISVFDVPWPPAMGAETTHMAHVPFDSHALAQSVDKLMATDVAPAEEFEGGYQDWKAAKGGVFTILVTGLPGLMFKTVSDGTPS
jgi:hypothetical protein